MMSMTMSVTTLKMAAMDWRANDFNALCLPPDLICQ
jgi:hypothetical protein